MLRTTAEGPYQVVDLVEEFVDFLAVHEADVRLAQEPPHLPLDVLFAHINHHHEGHQVVQHRGEQSVLLMFQPFTFRLAQVVIPVAEIFREITSVCKFVSYSLRYQ